MAFVARSIWIFFMVVGFCTIANASSVEIFKRDGYERLVVEDVLGDLVEQSANMFTFKTNQNITSDAAQKLKSIAIESIDVDGNKTTITVSNTVNEKRTFKIGNRLIVDLFVDEKNESSAQTQITIQSKIIKVEAEPINESSPITKNQPETTTPDENNEELIELNDTVPEITAIDTTPSQIAQPTVLTVSSTLPMSLAVFKRYDRLFVLTDSKNATLPPQISGAGKMLGWKIDEIPMDNGTAWMMPLPGSAYIRPEGGKLIWRIVISDQDPKLESANIIRNFDDVENPSVMIDMMGTNRILKFTDPEYGDDLAVFTVTKASDRMNAKYDFIDFDIIPAAIGAVIKPQNDGVQVASTNDFITISKTTGLLLAQLPHESIVRTFLKLDDVSGNGGDVSRLSNNRVFFFDDWSNGLNANSYINKRQELDAQLIKVEEEDKVATLFDLIKLHLAMNMGQEALGYLQMAAELNADVVNIPEYHGLTGAAHFLAAQYNLAAQSFANPLVDNNSEIMLWRAAAMLQNDDTAKAMELYPANAEIAMDYPYAIRVNVVSPIIQELLNRRDGTGALELLTLFEKPKQAVVAEQRATLNYLRGVAQKMTGYPEKAIKNLELAVNADKLGPYGAKSELLLIKDELARDTISLDDAIKRMERLRFVWRGDSLESDIYQSLGQLYIDKSEGRRGLSLLKRAAEIAPSSVERRSIVRQMAELYKEIFNGDAFQDLDPMEAISVYDEFKELTPVGAEGNSIIDRLADKLMEIDLMSRAVSVLQDKMVRLQGGQHAMKTGLRVAAIQLIDRKPTAAMDTLQKIDAMLMQYNGEDKSELNQKVILLKARSLADSGESQSALFMTEGLDDTMDVLRLRVDTAWDSGDWVAVSDNLNKLIERENITLAQPPTTAQAQMILNQAIALNLSNQRQALQQFASAYDLFMKQTPAYNTFQLVTRPLTVAALADRQSLLDMTSEVDLFSTFLEMTKSK